MNNKRINVQTLHCNQMSKDLLKIHQEVLSVIKQNRINLSPLSTYHSQFHSRSFNLFFIRVLFFGAMSVEMNLIKINLLLPNLTYSSLTYPCLI